MEDCQNNNEVELLEHPLFWQSSIVFFILVADHWTHTQLSTTKSTNLVAVKYPPKAELAVDTRNKESLAR